MMKKKVLVAAAHPDDEVLGCGGTIARHTAEGDEVHILILAEGLTSRDKKRDPEKHTVGLRKLSDAAQRAGALLGVSSVSLYTFPDNRMDSLDLLNVVKVVENFIYTIKPDVVYTHHWGDLNIDHRLTHEAVITACRPIPGISFNSLLFFEIVSSTEWQIGLPKAFVPNWFVDITESLELKLKALEVYSPEMRAWPHARSISAVEHLARWRGASVGLEAAEAFMLGRHVKR